MTDPILSKAMEKREEALREAERWEQWIRDYEKLAGPVEVLDIPMARKSSGEIEAADGVEIVASLHAPPHQHTEKANGMGLWPRN